LSCRFCVYLDSTSFPGCCCCCVCFCLDSTSFLLLDKFGCCFCLNLLGKLGCFFLFLRNERLAFAELDSRLGFTNTGVRRIIDLCGDVLGPIFASSKEGVLSPTILFPVLFFLDSGDGRVSLVGWLEPGVELRGDLRRAERRHDRHAPLHGEANVLGSSDTRGCVNRGSGCGIFFTHLFEHLLLAR
jgi:hypothetical protein